MADETTIPPAPEAPERERAAAAPAPAATQGPGQGPGAGARREHGHGPRREGAGPGGPRKGKRQYFRKRKVCRFCAERADYIDYKKAEALQSFVQDRGKVLPRRLTGTCSRHQRWLITAIKRARNIALLPFAAEL